MEKKHKEDLEFEIKRFKDIELSQMRIEESKNYSKKLENIRDEYIKEYNQKYELLKQRENDWKKRLEQKDKEMENIIYENRQKINQQLETLKQKENLMKAEMDNNIFHFFILLFQSFFPVIFSLF